MEPFMNATSMVKRAKFVMDFKTSGELTAYLGISHSTLADWCGRSSIDFPLLRGKLKKVDYNWLLTGKGSSKHRPKCCDKELAQGEIVGFKKIAG